MLHQVTRSLLPLGLARTLLLSPKDQGFLIAQVNDEPNHPSLSPLGVVGPSRARAIGRVGPPDVRLDARWQKSLTFYGKRFDDYGPSDPDWRLRRRIAAAPLARNLEQLGRDEDYALTGSYYAIFRSILAKTGAVPFVLLMPLPRMPNSLPVMLVEFASPRAARHYGDLLRKLMGSGPAPDRPAPPIKVDGIEVEELSDEEAAAYFGER
ncbi:MAG: hypothetical protein K2Y51_05940 [Gammaproteobacteria bacterium]|nr:hypothetical protein [Gammaproteobacteria bacterium]